MEYCFISDLHLQENTDASRLFDSFLQEYAGKLHNLFVLGDLFEYWIGDDLMTPYQKKVAKQLSTLADNGVKVFFLHGNRDFLIGKRFCQESKIKMLKQPFCLTINNSNYLLLHGDSLCINDKNYQRFKLFAQNSLTKLIYLGLPSFLRKSIANNIRLNTTGNMKTDPSIYDVDQSYTAEIMNNHSCKYIIHGHTHKAYVHTSVDSDPKLHRIVLGDWHDTSKIYLIDKNGDQEMIEISTK